MLKLQIIDVSEFDNRIKYGSEYKILLFCIDQFGNSYCLNIKNFKPFFYIDFDRNKYTIQDFEQIKIGKWEQPLHKLANQISIHKFKKLDEFQLNNNSYLKLQFKSLSNFNRVKKHFNDKVEINDKRVFIQRYESNILQFIRFFHTQNIPLSNWIQVDKNKLNNIDNNSRISICKYEFDVSFENIFPYDAKKIGPIKILSFDIECTSEDGSFPQPSRINDKIIQIGTTVETFGKGKDFDYNYIVSLKKCNHIDNTTVVNCNDELDLIKKWCDEVRRIDPDIITGYNIWGFDYEYIFERAKLLTSNDEILLEKILNISRLKTGKGNGFIKFDAPYSQNEKLYHIKTLSSSAMGDNILKYLNIIGRVNIDLLKYVRDNKKLPMYKLDFVAEKFIGQKKNNVTPNDIFNWYHEGKPDKVTDIAKYCIQDCKLVNKLVNKLSVIENSIGMANTCWVPLNFIFTRGQGIKVHSLVLKECDELGYILPHKTNFNSDIEFKGATVLTAKSGIHYYPVSALDFASLYPSSMISHNLCISSFIEEDKLNKYIEKFNWSVDKYRKVEWEEDGVVKKYFYVQPEKDNLGNIKDQDRAVLPQILLKLLNKRNETKKIMKKEKDEFKKAILDGLQLAYKVTANSVYGQLGSAVGPLGKVQVAASVTTTGRQLLELAQNFILKHYEGSTAVYGDTDSVFIKFNLKRHKKSCIFHKENMIERKKKYHKIKEDICTDMKISNEEFLHSRKAKAVMEKTDFLLYDKCGCEDIPDLMSEEALKESIRLACEVDSIITDLLPDKKIFDENGKQIDGCQQLEYEKTYMPYILFTKKRYVGKLFEHKTDLEKDWYLDYKGIVLKRRDNANIVKKVYKSCLMKIMESTKQDALKYLEDTLFDLMENDKKKIYPIEDFVLSKTLSSIEKYAKDKKFLQAIMILNKFLLIKKELSKLKISKENIILLIDNDPISTKFTLKKSFDTCGHTKYCMMTGVKKLSYKLSCDKCNPKYNMHFGINQYLDYLNDTYNSKSVKKEDRTITKLSELKTYRFDKKNKNHMTFINGIDMLSTYYNNKNNSNLKKLKVIFDKIQEKDIYNELLFCELRKINKTQVILTNRIRERDPGSEPQINERVQYCFIEVNGDERKYLQGDLVETPNYIIQNKIPINYNYYIKKQLENPLLQLFSFVDENKSKQIFNKIITLNKSKNNGQKSILEFMRKNKI